VNELLEEEELLNDLRAHTAKLLYQITQQQALGLAEYKICCEIDAELDALQAALRRRTRAKSI
jgi:hypothetical protein